MASRHCERHLETFAMKYEEKLTALRKRVLTDWHEAVQDLSYHGDANVVCPDERPYEEKFAKYKRAMEEDMKEMEEDMRCSWAKRHKQQVLNVWWIDGLALERQRMSYMRPSIKAIF